jgi:hypothetical protein
LEKNILDLFGWIQRDGSVGGELGDGDEVHKDSFNGDYLVTTLNEARFVQNSITGVVADV